MELPQAASFGDDDDEIVNKANQQHCHYYRHRSGYGACLSHLTVLRPGRFRPTLEDVPDQSRMIAGRRAFD